MFLCGLFLKKAWIFHRLKWKPKQLKKSSNVFFYTKTLLIVASKLYGVDATILIFVFVSYCNVLIVSLHMRFLNFFYNSFKALIQLTAALIQTLHFWLFFQSLNHTTTSFYSYSTFSIITLLRKVMLSYTEKSAKQHVNFEQVFWYALPKWCEFKPLSFHSSNITILITFFSIFFID